MASSSAAAAVATAAAAAPRCIGSRKTVPFVPPPWAAEALRGAPAERLHLGHTPTPLVRWQPLEAPGTEFWLKRDDLTGVELSGNKVRKLEFLMADALRAGADCVISSGGLQSNHCRAVAIAACELGLESHLLLRLEDHTVEDAVAASADIGLSGNLLLSRMVGARTWLVTKKEYQEHGSQALVERLRQRLVAEGRKPFVIPLGGSNPAGTWGYVSAFEELRLQAQTSLEGGGFFSDIIVSTGSAGSLAGVAIANAVAGTGAKVWGFGACDTPAWHHAFIDRELIPELAVPGGPAAGLRSEDIADIRQAKNLGYAQTTPEELRAIRELALRTGVILDPVYTGKAFICFSQLLKDSPELFGRRILFWHTGGLFGVWDKQAEFRALIDEASSGLGGRGAVSPLLATLAEPKAEPKALL